MKKRIIVNIFSLVLYILVFQLTGCVSIPLNVLQLAPQSLEKRQLQTRQYDTLDEDLILSASAGVLQDLGFTIDDSETELGLIFGSKDRNATNAGIATMAIAVDIMSAMAGTYSNTYQTIDDIQKIRICVVSKPSNNNISVRVSFQRMVWNKAGNLSRLETLDDPELYDGFFQRLSKSVFLEGHKI